MTGVGYSDTLPAGLLVSTPNGLTGSCGGTITATAGTGVISLNGATIAASGSFGFSVNVTGTAAGIKNNISGNVASAEGGTGGTASASTSVVGPPAIGEVFGSPNVPLNGVTSLSFTITNPAANTVALTGIAFTDTLPVGLVLATPNGLSNTCGGVSAAVAGGSLITLSAGSVGANTSCTLTVNVKGAASGSYTNITGTISSTNGGTGTTASATLNVASAPVTVEAFGAPLVPLGGTTILTFTITNPAINTIPLTGAGFIDSLPAGLVVSTPSVLTGSCGGGAIRAIAGTGSITLAGATIPASSFCTFSVSVTGITAGVKNNTVSVTSTEGGAGNTSNASLTVAAPPTIAKAFGAASVPLNGNVALTFTLTNLNPTVALTGVGFADALPAGLVIATPNGVTGSCGGGTITATAADTNIVLSGAILPAIGSCTFSVSVTGTTAGVQNNTTAPVASIEGGIGGTASASITVVAPPSIVKAFGAPNVTLNGTTSSSFTVTNPVANTVALTGFDVTDTLPVGLVVATPNGLTGSCGGTVTAAAGGQSISLSRVDSRQYFLHLQRNGERDTLRQLHQYNGRGDIDQRRHWKYGDCNARCSDAAGHRERIRAALVPLNGSTSLTFTITNPAANPIPLTGIAFANSLPAGLVVATPNGLTGSCGAGTITAIASSGSITLSAATVPASSFCTFSVNVTAQPRA